MISKEYFTFCVLAFNHEKYIIEHLESIKYLITKYGENIYCNIIISDDNSRDNTTKLIDKWLIINRSFFNKVTKLYNQKNIGTCQCTLNISKHLETKEFKLTAADDIYTSINIFEFIKQFKKQSIVSGLPIRVIKNNVQISKFEIFNYLASDLIYKNKNLINRLSNLSIINAPNIFYSFKYFKNDAVLSFLKNYDVVEDLPLQISIALNDPNSNIISTTTPVVLYRRTEGSTYITENSRFKLDQNKIFDFLIDYQKHKKKKVNVILLKNRKQVFNLNNRFKHLININRILFFSKVLCISPYVLYKYLLLNKDTYKHQKHYDLIKHESYLFVKGLDF